MKQASKSQKRIDFLEVLAKALSSEEVFEHIDYESKTEHQCKKFFKERLKTFLTQYALEDLELEEEKAVEVVESSLDFSQENNIMFMGT